MKTSIFGLIFLTCVASPSVWAVEFLQCQSYMYGSDLTGQQPLGGSLENDSTVSIDIDLNTQTQRNDGQIMSTQFVVNFTDNAGVKRVWKGNYRVEQIYRYPANSGELFYIRHTKNNPDDFEHLDVEMSGQPGFWYIRIMQKSTSTTACRDACEFTKFRADLMCIDR